MQSTGIGGWWGKPGAMKGGGAGPGPRPLASIPTSPAANSRCLSARCRMMATICSRDAGCIKRCSMVTLTTVTVTTFESHSTRMKKSLTVKAVKRWWYFEQYCYDVFDSNNNISNEIRAFAARLWLNEKETLSVWPDNADKKPKLSILSPKILPKPTCTFHQFESTILYL